MNLIERLLNGVDNGVNRQWRYTKDLLKIKPEYLLTISVADELTEGFDNYCGMDIAIKLEEPVHLAANGSFMKMVGIKKYFKVAKEWINRNGKADIFVECENKSYIIELKGLNPNATEVKKELHRFISFLTIYDGNTDIVSCHLVFPSLDDRKKWLDKQISAVKLPSSLKYVFNKRGKNTGEQPEDGIPFYYANVLSIEYA